MIDNMDNKPPLNSVSRTLAEQAQIAALEQELSQLAAIRSELRTQLKSAHAEIQQGGSMDDETVRSIQAIAADGLSVTAICKFLGISRATYYRHRDRLASQSLAAR